MDPFDILKVKDDTSDEDVKKALRRVYIKCHPDKHDGAHMKEINEEKFKAAQKAFNDIMLLRKNHNNRNRPQRNTSNLSRRTYNDILYSMYAMDQISLFDKKFVDKNFMDKKIQEIEEQMNKKY